MPSSSTFNLCFILMKHIFNGTRMCLYTVFFLKSRPKLFSVRHHCLLKNIGESEKRWDIFLLFPSFLFCRTVEKADYFKSRRQSAYNSAKCNRKVSKSLKVFNIKKKLFSLLFVECIFPEIKVRQRRCTELQSNFKMCA